jgi:hypothetical protein
MDKSLIVVYRTSTPKQLNKALGKLKRRKYFNARKHLGSLKGAFGNALEYQTSLRDEWA